MKILGSLPLSISIFASIDQLVDYIIISAYHLNTFKRKIKDLEVEKQLIDELKL